MPHADFIPPQLATAREAVPEGEGWVHEIKFDGERILAVIRAGASKLLSRNTLDWSRRFPEIVAALGALGTNDAVLDGEVCVLDREGRSDFAALRALVGDRRPARLSYLVFDLLRLDGEDLRGLPLLKRKALLRKLVPKTNPVVQYVDHFTGDALKFFVGVCEKGFEGIVSKRADAGYESGRSASWVKVKCVDAKEFVVAGYIPSERRSYFKSLILGAHEKQGLVYRGLVGAGFTAALGAKIARRLKPLATGEPPLAKVPWELRRGARWVKPEYVAMVRFTEITRGGALRHPRFLRLRHESEPGVAEHLRSRTIADRRPKTKRVRKRPPEPPKPDRAALIEALRKSAKARPKPRSAR